MEKKNNWKHSLTTFEDLIVYPQNTLEWKTISDWKFFWKTCWSKQDEEIRNKQPFNISSEYLESIGYKYQSKTFTSNQFKQLCLNEITESSFPTFLSLVVMFEEFNILKELDQKKLDELNSFDIELFNLYEEFNISKPQLHQTVIYLLIKVSKILNGFYPKEELTIDVNNLKKLNNHINISIKMAINDLSIHKYNMITHDKKIIEFEYDILIQFLNMLTNSYVSSLINNNEPKLHILNEIGIFEHKMKVILDNIELIESVWLKTKTKESVLFFLEMCQGLKNYKGSDKVTFVKDFKSIKAINKNR